MPDSVIEGDFIFSPITHATDWQYITIGGVKSPGVIAVNGIRGFKRETEWDKKKGKGRKGATLTLQQVPPAEGQITFVLWLDDHFRQWIDFLPLLKYDTKSAGKNDVFTIYHPALSMLGIGAVVTKSVSPTEHVGHGRYEVVVDLIEWNDPPATDVTATPTAAVDAELAVPGDPPDPIADQDDKDFAATAARAAAP